MENTRIAASFCILTVLVGSGLQGAEIDFAKQIRPIFEARCFECHGAETREAGLRLDRKADALAGGDSGTVIVPGEPESSLLIKYVSGDDPDRLMPPNGDNLTVDQIGVLTAWIQQGAEWPDGLDPKEERNPHWAYQPLTRADPPTGNARPIDA
ncbi:MAG: hypothetical protein KDA90_06595, partial [Planctomycetaceae bacterium]|nr:hypothetical protein [Planctomycetaceae bacterium]